MPYVTRHMASYLRDKGLSQCEGTSDRQLVLRNMPSSVCPASVATKKSKSIQRGSRSRTTSIKSSDRRTCSASSKKSNTSQRSLVVGSTAAAGERYKKALNRLSFDEKKLVYTVELLKKAILRLEATEGAQDYRQSKDWNHYRFDFDVSLVPRNQCKLCEGVFRCNHRNEEFKDFPLCVKVYPIERVCQNHLFLRISRFLGRKHPNIIQTWAIFFKDNKSMLVHEWFLFGTAESNVEQKGPFREEQVAEMAAQLGKAMDYLGDMGLSHRALAPRYIFISRRDTILAKLGGFHHSIVYWDVKQVTVALVPCLPVNRKPPVPEFIAPECYGDAEREAFDPINADIWSFGASMFWMLTRKYPYDFSRENPQIEQEIRDNIRNTKTSARCQTFLRKVLCTDADKRINFDKINTNPWLMQTGSTSVLNPK